METSLQNLLPYEVVDKLCQRIEQFLVDCGGIYKSVTGLMTMNIMEALVTRNFVIKIDKTGDIRYFACYWKIHPEDLEAVKERYRPYDTITGSIVYVAEMGNKEGRQGIKEISRKIREKAKGCQGVFWHRPAKEDKVYYFPSQKGIE